MAHAWFFYLNAPPAARTNWEKRAAYVSSARTARPRVNIFIGGDRRKGGREKKEEKRSNHRLSIFRPRFFSPFFFLSFLPSFFLSLSLSLSLSFTRLWKSRRSLSKMETQVSLAATRWISVGGEHRRETSLQLNLEQTVTLEKREREIFREGK